MKRVGVIVILLLAFCGLANSMYLAEHEINGTPLICNIQNLSGCNIVASSQYSHLFGIPLAEYGVLFYSILFVLAALELVLFNKVLRRVLQGMSLIGVVASLCFTSIQIFLIGALCIYCSVSAGITLLIFIFASLIEPVRRNVSQENFVSSPSSSLRMPPTI